jgi:hypothetical protein
VASFELRPLHPLGHIHRYPFYKRLVGPQIPSRSGDKRKKSLLLPRIKPRSPSPKPIVLRIDLYLYIKKINIDPRIKEGNNFHHYKNYIMFVLLR